MSEVVFQEEPKENHWFWRTDGSAKTVVPIMISVDDFGRLDPQEDITPLESIHLSIMLTCASLNRGVAELDFAGYIKEHGLQRHFRKV